MLTAAFRVVNLKSIASSARVGSIACAPGVNRPTDRTVPVLSAARFWDRGSTEPCCGLIALDWRVLRLLPTRMVRPARVVTATSSDRDTGPRPAPARCAPVEPFCPTLGREAPLAARLPAQLSGSAGPTCHWHQISADHRIAARAGPLSSRERSPLRRLSVTPSRSPSSRIP